MVGPPFRTERAEEAKKKSSEENWRFGNYSEPFLSPYRRPNPISSLLSLGRPHIFTLKNKTHLCTQRWVGKSWLSFWQPCYPPISTGGILPWA